MLIPTSLANQSTEVAAVSAFDAPLAMASSQCAASSISVARNIFLFFAVNIVGHAITMTKRPGQRLGESVFRATIMILLPLVGRLPFSSNMVDVITVWQNRHTGASAPIPWYKQPIHYLRTIAQVLAHNIILWYNSFRRDRLVITIFRLAITISRMIKPSRNHEGSWGMQTAVNCGAIAVEIHEHDADALGLQRELNIQGVDALFLDGSPVDINPTDPNISYRYVPIGTVCRRDTQVVPTSSSMQIIITIVQVSYSTIELYESWVTSIQQDGLSSPFIVVIPYIIGSIVNCVINLFVASYPYVIVLPSPKKDNSQSAGISPTSFSNTGQLGYSAYDRTVPPDSEERAEKDPSTCDNIPKSITRNAVAGDDELQFGPQAAHSGTSSTLAIAHAKHESSCSEEANTISMRKWFKETYSLELPENLKTRRQRPASHIPIFLAFFATLAIILAITRARIGDRRAAVSFLCWIFGGSLVLFINFIRSGLSKKPESKKPEFDMWFILLGLSFYAGMGLSIWGMVTAVRVLEPYYLNCEIQQ